MGSESEPGNYRTACLLMLCEDRSVPQMPGYLGPRSGLTCLHY